MRRATWLLFTLATLAATSPIGCGDECGISETWCDGNVAVTCTQPSENGRRVASRVDCGQLHCVVPSVPAGQYEPAFCVPDPVPDPSCAPNMGGYCKEEAVIEICRRGYRMSEVKCDFPARCVATTLETTCAGPRPGLACFDANHLLGIDASPHAACTVRQAGGPLDDSCPVTSLPGASQMPSPGCCLANGHCGILLTDLAVDGLPVGCVEPTLLGKPASVQRCGASADAGRPDDGSIDAGSTGDGFDDSGAAEDVSTDPGTEDDAGDPTDASSSSLSSTRQPFPIRSHSPAH